LECAGPAALCEIDNSNLGKSEKRPARRRFVKSTTQPRKERITTEGEEIEKRRRAAALQDDP